MKAWKIAIIVAVVAVIALFWRGLHMDPRSIPTVLEGKPAVTFAAQEIKAVPGMEKTTPNRPDCAEPQPAFMFSAISAAMPASAKTAFS